MPRRRLAEEYQLREDSLQPQLRPSFSKLISKLRALPSLQDHPDAVLELIHLLAHRSFVFEKSRPEHAFRAMQRMHSLWQLSLGSPSVSDGDDEGNERQLESALKTVTGDENSKSRSLPSTFKCQSLVCSERATRYIHGIPFCDKHSDGTEETMTKVRNDTTPGPSHKSPVGWKMKGSTGFTVPGFPGKWLWKASNDEDEPPDMNAVVGVLASGFAGGEAPDLEDKKLKKRVRNIIEEHTWDTVATTPSCTCSKEFDFFEQWAIHVRKLIWKELAK